jgi:hypothetical protein
MSERSVETAADDAWRLLEPLPTKESACCCSAHPTVRVLIPVNLGYSEVVELLLCTHHYRSGIDTLNRIGAAAFDAGGTLLLPRSWSLNARVTTVG